MTTCTRCYETNCKTIAQCDVSLTRLELGHYFSETVIDSIPHEWIAVCRLRDGSLDLNKLSHLMAAYPW